MKDDVKKFVDELFLNKVKKGTEPDKVISDINDSIINSKYTDEELGKYVIPLLYLTITNNNSTLDIRLRGKLDTLPIKLFLTDLYKKIMEGKKWKK